MPALRRFNPERDGTDVYRAIALAFGGTPEGVGSYAQLVGTESLRVLDEVDGKPRAALAAIPMGHWFGGRTVGSLGIAAVAVAPEARGGGRARRMMEAVVREAAADGFPLLSLFASTQALYRQVGFEQAGSKFETRIPLRQLTIGTRELPIEPVTALIDGQPNERLVRSYSKYAAAFEGCLDRPLFTWKRIQQNRDQTFHGFAVVPDGPGGEIEGHVFLGQARHESGRHDVVLSDCAFSTERASLRILGLLRDYATMGLTLSFIGGPCHPLVTFLPQQWIEMSFKDYWMIRVANLAAAIEVRGYAPSVAVDTVINVRDPLLPANDGTWRMSVAGGRGHLERHDGPPAFSTDIRTFASIYAGFLSPIQAILFGRATGSATAAAALGGAFAGTAPWMVDHF